MLLDKITDGEIDPSFIISHRLPLDDAAHAYDIFSRQAESCTKVVLSTVA